ALSAAPKLPLAASSLVASSSNPFLDELASPSASHESAAAPALAPQTHSSRSWGDAVGSAAAAEDAPAPSTVSIADRIASLRLGSGPNDGIGTSAPRAGNIADRIASLRLPSIASATAPVPDADHSYLRPAPQSRSVSAAAIPFRTPAVATVDPEDSATDIRNQAQQQQQQQHETQLPPKKRMPPPPPPPSSSSSLSAARRSKTAPAADIPRFIARTASASPPSTAGAETLLGSATDDASAATTYLPPPSPPYTAVEKLAAPDALPPRRRPTAPPPPRVHPKAAPAVAPAPPGVPMPMARGISSGSIISSISSLPDTASKRDKIIFEIVETERRFLSDMRILKKVYAVPAEEARIFPPTDLKVLFGTLDTVIKTSAAFLEALDAACNESPQRIGAVFQEMIPTIEETYCEYCRNNEAAMTKLAEFASPDCSPQIRAFLKECQVQLQGQTGAWDLSSLVIKPVQRQLVKETAPQHEEFELLVTVYNDIERVATKINEAKKRKDTVEKYVEGKGKVNVIHGISKKLTRGVQGLKQKTGTGGEVTRDEAFDEVHEEFNRQFLKTQNLSKYLTLWIRSVKEYLECQENLATSFEEVLMVSAQEDTASTTSKYLFVVVEYRKACQRLAAGPWKEADAVVKNVINPSLSVLLTKFRDPKLVIAKREKKRLDYDRAKAIKAKGEL
ncbi:hypothetical protein HK405_003642, partial [Cladochytrium tenue]